MENENILRSWKEISKYLNQDIRTCQRWEIEFGLPVRRISNHSLRSKVFAYRSEIDQWLKEKTKNHILRKKAFFERREVYLGLISFLAIIAGFFSFLYFTHQKPISSSFKGLSIAVCPFEVVNPTESDEYISEGLTAQTINLLTKYNQLQVIPVPAAAGGEAQSAELLKRDLKADYVLAAKIEKDDAKIKICAKLFRSKDKKTIMDEVIEDRLSNLYSVEENLCLKILENLDLLKDMDPSLLFGEEKAVNYEAVDSVLAGNYILNRVNENNDTPWKLSHKGNYYWSQSTKESNELAIKFFNQAIGIDSNYADAYIGLAHCYANNVNFGWNSNVSWLNLAEEMLQKAQKIDPDLPDYYPTLIEVYLLKDTVFDVDLNESAFQLAQEGIKKYPNHAQMNSITGYCYLRRFGGEGNEADFEKALEYKDKSFWLNTYASHNFLVAILLMLDRKFDLALNRLDIAKNYAPPQMADFTYGEIFYYKGDLDKSKEIFLQMEMPTEMKVGALLYMSMIAAQRGDKSEVQRIIQDINNQSPDENYFFEMPLRLASIYMGIGERELGYKYLKSFFSSERAKKMHYVYSKYVDLDKNFDSVRNDEELKKILSKE